MNVSEDADIAEGTGEVRCKNCVVSNSIFSGTFLDSGCYDRIMGKNASIHHHRENGRERMATTEFSLSVASLTWKQFYNLQGALTSVVRFMIPQNFFHRKDNHP